MVINTSNLSSAQRWLNQYTIRLSRINTPLYLFLLLLISAITVISVTLVQQLFGSPCYDGQKGFAARQLVKPNNDHIPTIYIVTPTYARHVQKAELTRLSHTFLLVPKIHWILVEDSDRATKLVSAFVERLDHEFGFKSITHLQTTTPDQYKLKAGQPSWKFPKGIWQRNKALDWLLGSPERDPSGIVYFADDDNTYDLGLFEEMRYTRGVSVWPVALVGGMAVERPLVRDGKVVGFNSMWQSKRPFPIDMAGFAVSLKALESQNNVRFSSANKIGYVESHFLSQLINSWDQLEPKANNCTKVLVWHTRSQAPVLHEEKKLGEPSSKGLEV